MDSTGHLSKRYIERLKKKDLRMLKIYYSLKYYQEYYKNIFANRFINCYPRKMHVMISRILSFSLLGCGSKGMRKYNQ